jgi:MFS family permease
MTDKHAFGRKELYAVILIAAINLFIFADQNLMAPNLTQIAHDFGFGAVERDVKLGGQISLVFWVLGALVTLGIGYFTDMISRKRLFVAVAIVGELPCLLSGFAETYTQLFWLRALTGIGIGGMIPITFSMIGDFFSHRNRAVAAAWITLVQGLGVAVGQLVAGFIGPEYGWRLPFIIVAAPSFLFILLFWFTVKEQPRGIAEESLKELIESGAVYTGRINFALYRSIFKIKTNLIVLLQGVPGCIPWGVFFVFLNDFYSQNKGFSVEMATLIVMMGGAATLVGSFAGGLIGNKIYNRNPRYLPLFTGLACIAGVIPMALLLNYPSQIGVEHPSIIVPLLLAFATGFIVIIPAPNLKAITLNVNSPETRGSILSLGNLTDSLGQGFGPALISLFIIGFGRVAAFNIANVFWVACGLLQLLMIFTFPKDGQRLTALMKEKAKDMSAQEINHG